jgi:hypothetical protein
MPGHDKQYFEVLFAGDPYLDDDTRQRAAAGRVCKIVSPIPNTDGILQASCDITYREVEPEDLGKH